MDDGDLIILIRKLLSSHGEGTVCISKVKSHADESLVRGGHVRALDRYGNARADEAADFGRRFGLRLLMLGEIFLEYVGGGILLFWFYIGSLLLFLVLSLIVMTLLVLAPHPLIWSAGGLPKRRRIVDVVRNVALLPGPLRLWDSGLVRVPPVAVTAEDVCLWPYSVGILVKSVTFLGSLHWPSAGADLGPGRISCQRFQSEKAVPRYRRADRPICVGCSVWSRH